MQRERGRAPNKSADISFSLKDLTLESVKIFKRFDQGCNTGFDYFSSVLLLFLQNIAFFYFSFKCFMPVLGACSHHHPHTLNMEQCPAVSCKRRSIQ